MPQKVHVPKGSIVTFRRGLTFVVDGREVKAPPDHDLMIEASRLMTINFEFAVEGQPTEPSVPGWRSTGYWPARQAPQAVGLPSSANSIKRVPQ